MDFPEFLALLYKIGAAASVFISAVLGYLVKESARKDKLIAEKEERLQEMQEAYTRLVIRCLGVNSEQAKDILKSNLENGK